MSKKEKTKKPFNWSRFWEIFWLVLFGLFAVAGLVMGILGVYANNVQSVLTNPIYLSQKSFATWLNWSFLGMIDYRIFGVVLLLIGGIGIVVDLFFYANKLDKEKLVKARRDERLKALMADESILLKSEAKSGIAPEAKQDK